MFHCRFLTRTTVPLCIYLDFKILMLVYKALYGFRPKYISDLLQHYVPSRTLRLSGKDPLSVPRRKTRHGEAAFSYNAPYIWGKRPENSVPCFTSIVTSPYLKPVILVSKAWTRFLASSFQRWVLFCWAARRRVRSAQELRLLSSSSCTRASNPCSFRLYSCSICASWGGAAETHN